MRSRSFIDGFPLSRVRRLRRRQDNRHVEAHGPALQQTELGTLAGRADWYHDFGPLDLPRLLACPLDPPVETECEAHFLEDGGVRLARRLGTTHRVLEVFADRERDADGLAKLPPGPK